MRRPRRMSIGVVATIACASIGCARILGYDDLSPRAAEASDASLDTTIESNDAADETIIDDSDASPTVVPVRPPPRPTGAAVPSSKGKTLWVIARQFFLGTKTVSGALTSDAWKDWGYDIDHVCTGPTEAAANSGTCLKYPTAKSEVLLDGNGCRDNVWASELMKLIVSFDSVVEDSANDYVTRGFGSWIFVVRDLDDGANDPYAPGAMYKAADWQIFHTGAPKFDGSDVREVTGDSVIGNDPMQPLTTFPNGYVSNGVWVSGDRSKIHASIPVSGVNANFDMVGGVVTIALTDDHSTGTLGLIAGALRTEQVQAFIDPVGAALGLCPGTPLYDAVLNRLKEYVDVVADAPDLQNTTVQCDAMSTGIGFTVVPIQPVTQVIDEIPPPSGCETGPETGSETGSETGDVEDAAAE